MTYIVLLFLLALPVIAHFWGVDSRDGRDWQPYDLMNNRSRR